MKSGLCLLYASPVIIAILILASIHLLLSTEYTQAAAAVRYVSPGGMCGATSPCYSTVQSAVDAAEAGDEIRIAEGVYTDVNHYAGLAQLVYVSKTVTLRGGYSIDDWENSMPVTHQTVLDAQSVGRDLYIIGPISPTIENLSVRGSDAVGLGGTSRFEGASAGGGLYAISATVTVSNTIWSHNRADVGGALYLERGHFNLFDSTIFSNTGALLGGGVFLETGNTLLANNVIEANGATYGGGLAVYGGRAELKSNQIISNQCSYNGGGVLFAYADGSLIGNIITDNTGGSGGGASLDGDILVSQNTISQNSGEWGGGIALSDGNISLIGNTITHNRSSSLGGGVALSYFSNAGDPNRKMITNNIISGNTSSMGGGLFLQSVRPVLTRNFIQDNSAQERGGGIYSNDSEISIDGDTITGNTSHGTGGGLALFGPGHQDSLINVILADNQSDSDGSGLYIDSNVVDVSQTTIANNRGGTGIFVQSSPFGGFVASKVTMTNTIVVSHTVAISASLNSTVTIHGVLWFGNGMEISGAGTHFISDMIYGNPAFKPGDYHLSASSAAIDSGIASNIFYDIDGEPRPYRRFDLGADEFWPAGVLKQIYLPVVPH